jgi:hypothetical protein
MGEQCLVKAIIVGHGPMTLDLIGGSGRPEALLVLISRNDDKVFMWLILIDEQSKSHTHCFSAISD